MIMILIKHNASRAALSNASNKRTKVQSTTIPEWAVIDRNTSSKCLYVIFMPINRSFTVLLLEAEEGLVHSQHYSLALCFCHNCSQFGQHSATSELERTFLKNSDI